MQIYEVEGLNIFQSRNVQHTSLLTSVSLCLCGES